MKLCAILTVFTLLCWIGAVLFVKIVPDNSDISTIAELLYAPCILLSFVVIVAWIIVLLP